MNCSKCRAPGICICSADDEPTSYGDQPPVPAYPYASMQEYFVRAARNHLARALRAFTEGNDQIAYDRMGKAARAYIKGRPWTTTMTEPTFPKAGDEPFTDRCSNPGFTDRWTCPGCYADILSASPGTFQCKSCGRKIDCTVDYEPVCVAILDEGSQDAERSELRP